MKVVRVYFKCQVLHGGSQDQQLDLTGFNDLSEGGSEDRARFAAHYPQLVYNLPT